MQEITRPGDRLIVAADFKPTATESARDQVLRFADAVHSSGIYFKLNSALRGDYDLAGEIFSRSLHVFADLKLNDIPETLSIDGTILHGKRTMNLLTVMCSSGTSAMKALKAELPNTEVLGVTVLTSLSDEEVEDIYGVTPEEAVMKLALMGEAAGIDGFICPARHGQLIRSVIKRSMTINSPGIRPHWHLDVGDQNAANVVTPAQAMELGVDRIVIGRPITQAKNPRDAVMRTLDEIDQATNA